MDQSSALTLGTDDSIKKLLAGVRPTNTGETLSLGMRSSGLLNSTYASDEVADQAAYKARAIDADDLAPT